MKRVCVPAILMSALFMASCSPSGPSKVSGPGITTSSGLQYWDVKTGNGQVAEPGKIVVVDYTGWLADGAKFDSSRDRAEPFQFRLGAGRVIKGWDEGVAGMKIGGKRQLRIPPGLGYGARKMESIPPNSTLIFDVELLEVK